MILRDFFIIGLNGIIKYLSVNDKSMACRMEATFHLMKVPTLGRPTEIFVFPRELGVLSDKPNPMTSK